MYTHYLFVYYIVSDCHTNTSLKHFLFLRSVIANGCTVPRSSISWCRPGCRRSWKQGAWCVWRLRLRECQTSHINTAQRALPALAAWSATCFCNTQTADSQGHCQGAFPSRTLDNIVVRTDERVRKATVIDQHSKC